MTPEDFATEVITCWIPLVDVNEAMGSLQIHPNVAKDERLLDTGGTPEKPRGGLIVPEALPPDPPLWMNMKAGEPHDHRWDLGCILLKMPAISLRAGDVLLISAYTPHRSTPNTTELVRWTLVSAATVCRPASPRSV